MIGTLKDVLLVVSCGLMAWIAIAAGFAESPLIWYLGAGMFGLMCVAFWLLNEPFGRHVP